MKSDTKRRENDSNLITDYIKKRSIAHWNVCVCEVKRRPNLNGRCRKIQFQQNESQMG